MERYFDEELRKFNQAIVAMAGMAEEAIQNSVEALKTRNADMAKQVIESDKNIDETELLIEEMAIDMLALRQPMAKDLRVITTGMKINAELERIADLAVNISDRVVELADKPLLKPLIDIPKLTAIARRMVRQAIESFVSEDENIAREVILSDARADELRNLIQQELIDDFLLKDLSAAPRAVALILIARHLERICDHATNIAEDVIYMIKAKVVKHHPDKLASESNN